MNAHTLLAGAQPSTSTAGEHLPVVHHRIAVWDLDGHDAMGDDAMRVVAVVSQSDVLRCVRARIVWHLQMAST